MRQVVIVTKLLKLAKSVGLLHSLPLSALPPLYLRYKEM